MQTLELRLFFDAIHSSFYILFSGWRFFSSLLVDFARYHAAISGCPFRSAYGRRS
jgi:hypothetical protein